VVVELEVVTGQATLGLVEDILVMVVGMVVLVELHDFLTKLVEEEEPVDIVEMVVLVVDHRRLTLVWMDLVAAVVAAALVAPLIMVEEVVELAF